MGLFSALLGSGFFYYFIFFQVLCGVHCVRTGRSRYWLWIILMFSGVGCLVYFFAEMLPSLRYSSGMRRASSAITGIFDPDRDLRETGAGYAISNNVETTCAYAEQLVRKGQLNEAIELYNNSRKGLFRHDPTVLVGLAKTYFTADRFDECVTVLEELIQHNPEHKVSDMRLLHAQALEAAGRPEEALKEYQAWGESHPGPEAKCRYALLLKKLGDHDKALVLFKDVRLYAVNAPKHYLRQHKEWVDMAVRECKAAEQRAG